MSARGAAERAARSGALEWLARAGLAARALVYVLIAALALLVAFGSDASVDGDLDRLGALALTAQRPLGRLAVAALAVAIAGYALWSLGLAVLPPPTLGRLRRVKHAGAFLLYGAVSVLALRLVMGSSGDDRLEESDATAALMRLPAGPLLMGLVGAGFLGYAGWSIHRAASGRWRRSFDMDAMSLATRRWTTVVSVAGLASKGVVHLIIAAFLFAAAVTHDPDDVVGLDGVLRSVGRTTWGGALLCLLACGVLARGITSAIEARYRRLLR